MAPWWRGSLFAGKMGERGCLELLRWCSHRILAGVCVTAGQKQGNSGKEGVTVVGGFWLECGVIWNNGGVVVMLLVVVSWWWRS